MRIVSGVARAVIWLLAALLIAIGAAGIGVAANPLPTESTRPELFAPADAQVVARLAALDPQLRAVQDRVAELADLSRAALVDLNGGDHDALVADLDRGDALAIEIGSQATEIASALRDIPVRADDWRLSPSVAARLAAAGEAVTAIRPLADLWNRVGRGALPASAIARHLAEHDQVAYAATQQGVAGRYAAALERLVEAQAELDAAEAVREEVAESVDTTTLDLWIERNRAYDDALTRLYRALRDAGGNPDDAARSAFADVERAEQRLPPDTRGIVVIMAELAQGGLNQAAIRIEEARAALAEALAAVD